MIFFPPSLSEEGGGGRNLHGVAELLRPLRLLGEHGVRWLADGDAAQRLADGVAQLFGRGLLRGGGGRGGVERGGEKEEE